MQLQRSLSAANRGTRNPPPVRFPANDRLQVLKPRCECYPLHDLKLSPPNPLRYKCTMSRTTISDCQKILASRLNLSSRIEVLFGCFHFRFCQLGQKVI